MSKRPAEDESASSSKKPRTDPNESLTTLRVSNLPVGFENSDLSTLFAQAGSLRSAFVVSDRDTGISKGYGYVKFQDAKDAEKALATLDYTNVKGQQLRIQWAHRRQRTDADTQVTTEKPGWMDRKQAKKERATRTIVPADQEWDSNRIIVVKMLGGGVEIDLDDFKKVLYKKTKKLLAAMPNIPPDSRLEVKVISQTEAQILAPTPRVGHQLSAKINNHVIKSKFIVSGCKHELDYLTKKGKGVGARLILRNLHFNTSAFDLYASFAPFGSIHSVETPVDKAGKGRGFAFVWFVHKKAAEAAIQKMNAKLLYPGIGDERIKEGGEGKKQTRQRLKANGVDLKKDGRPVAVDWALSKEQFEKAQADPEPAHSAEDESAAGSDQDKHEESAVKGENSDEDVSPEEAEEEDSDEEEEEEDSEDDFSPVEEDEEEELEEEVKPKQEIGTTVFVRNIQFEATEDELYALFKSFGAVRYARIVVDKTTGRSRGTGFVNFYRDQDAQKVINLSDTLATRNETQPSKNPFSHPSVIAVDPSSSKAASLTLHGRVLAVTQAVSKDSAEALREDRDRNSSKKDRRNLYLLHEGYIEEDAVQAKYLHKSDLEARQSSYNARKSLLRTNPSLYISRTRLSVRQIPLFVTDSMLKRLALYALKSFENDVKTGRRKELTADELRVEAPVDADGKPLVLGLESGPKAPKVKDGKVIPPSRVSQAKILRQTDKLDPLTGKGKSKGFGFLELNTHADALKVLRWINANSDIPALLKSWQKPEVDKELKKLLAKGQRSDVDDERVNRLQKKVEELSAAPTKTKEDTAARTLIVEFSIENAQTVKRRQERTEKTKVSQVAASKKRAAVDADEEPSPKRPKKAVAVPLSELSEKKFGGVIGRKRKERKAKQGKP